jgi:uncharacterized protein YhaN
MRFQLLKIPAFGPFTDLELSFPAAAHDLHVIYGENEAGKSSLLRAIRDLLFGIHGQSTDNFVHDYKKLLLLGEIENRAGVRLIFQRRKGNKNTLLDESGNALPDSALQPFLGPVDQAYFSTMFGLGGNELREGARQLLQGEGEIGGALFSASLGGTPVQRVLDALVEESEQLFKGRATANVSIRPAASRYKELMGQSRESVVNADTWTQLIKDLESQEASKVRLENEIADREREVAWIQRCEDALPSVGRLKDEMARLKELPILPEVASDFVERAKSARTAASDSSSKVENLTAQIAHVEAELANCVTSPDVMAEGDTLDELHQDRGAYRKRNEDLIGIERKLAGIEPVLRAGMKNLEVQGELDSLENLRLPAAIRVSCEEAAKSLRDVSQQLAESGRKQDELKQTIEDLGEELESLADTDLAALREALAVAAAATDADKTLEASQASVEGLIRKASQAGTFVPEVPKDLDAASHLPIPSLATIRKCGAQFDDLKRDRESSARRIRDEENNIKSLQAELSRIEHRGELPTEGSLKAARDHRDRGWQLVIADWKGAGEKEQFESNLPLDEAFPRAVIKADEIADKLRLYADAVAQAEEKRRQIQAGQGKVEDEKRAVAALETSIKECRDSWEAEWKQSGVTPRSPAEMEEWRERWLHLREVISKLREAESTFESKRKKIDDARTSLAAALGESDKKTFSVLFEAARSRVQQGEEATGRRKTLAEQLQKRRKESEGTTRTIKWISKDQESATQLWESQRRAAGLPENISADSGLSLLQERKELLASFDHWKELSGEANEVKEALLRYEQTVQEKADKLSIAAAGAEAQEAALWKALREARDAQTKHDQLKSQLGNRLRDLGSAKQTEAQAVRSLEELLSLVKLNTPAELEPLIANLEKHAILQGRIDNLTETLGGLARDQRVDDFIAGVQRENADELPRRRAELDSEKAEKETTLQEVLNALTGLNRTRSELEKAGDAAADFRQQAESEAATLKRDASRFVRLRLAAHFLRTQIEQFREENQGPLLERSGQIFTAITRGAFGGLAAEFTDQDVPTMTGRKADGLHVPVGGMSEGTRDQLYLALRLAALERHLEEHEPMPLILDDLLITFDDERAKAILPQLARMATKTQIFLFTHHQHLVELCRQTLGENQFRLHRLEAGL